MRNVPQFAAICIAFGMASLGTAQELPKGEVVERVTCQADPTETYALYLPASYDSSSIWPVIYCFDPGARGPVAVEGLRTAAERFGYVVVASNNSRNGDGAETDKAARAMIIDVERRFRIDRRQVYSAGFSGGARVAVQVAMNGVARGVIACSAGFALGPQGIPPKVPFAFFGTGGLEDMNLAEMIETDRILDSRGAEHRLEIFSGGHDWAPAALMNDAVQFLEMHALRSGIRAIDAAQVKAALDARIAAVSGAPELEAWQGLRAVASDFHGLADTAALEQRVETLEQTAAVRKWKDDQQALVTTEDKLMRELLDVAHPAQMKATATDLRKKAASSTSPVERQMAIRLAAGFTYTAKTYLHTLFEGSNYAEAITLIEALLVFNPGDPDALNDLARAQALMTEGKPGQLSPSPAGRSQARP